MTRGIKLGLGVLIVAGLTSLVVWEHRRIARCEAERAALQRQGALLAEVAADNERLSNRLAQAQAAPSGEQATELLRLRNLVRTLREQTNQLATVQAQNRRLKQALDRVAQSAPAPEEEEEAKDPQRRAAIAKMNDAKHLILAFMLYANEHRDQFPTSLEQVDSYVQTNEQRGGWALTRTNQFELVYQGATTEVAKPAETIVLRERQAWQSKDGKWVKAYGFADGHSEIRTEPPGGFEAWEAEHIVSPGADHR